MGISRKIANPIDPEEDDSDAPDPRPYEKLATAIIVRAVRDARYTPTGISLKEQMSNDEVRYKMATREEAKDWLLSPVCRFFCHSLGIDFAIIQTWVYAGCPKPPDALAMADDFGFGGYKRRVERERKV